MGTRHAVTTHTRNLPCLVLNLVVHKAATRLHVFSQAFTINSKENAVGARQIIVYLSYFKAVFYYTLRVTIVTIHKDYMAWKYVFSRKPAS